MQVSERPNELRHLQVFYSTDRIQTKKEFYKGLFIRYIKGLSTQCPEAVSVPEIHQELTRIKGALK